jgi:hypothetical protein
MNTNLLKLFAGSIIVSSQMESEVKKDLLNFVENASDYQVKTFLLDAEMVNDTDNAFTLSILDSKFEISAIPVKISEFERSNFFTEAGGRVAKLRKSAMSLKGAAGGSVLWATYRKIRSVFDNCTSRCGKYELNTSRRQHCMIKCRVDKYKAKLSAAQKANNKAEIEKVNRSLAKARATLEKSVRSFQSRKVDEPK